MMQEVKNWCLGIWHWAREQPMLWLTVAVLVAAGALVWWMPLWCLKDRILYAGTTLQAAGLITVWVGFERTRKLFGYEYSWVACGRWLRQIPLRPSQRNRTAQLSGIAIATSTGSASATLTTDSKDLTTRVNVLEHNLRTLDEKL